MDISLLNSKKHTQVFMLALLMLLCACDTNLDYLVTGYKQKIIVEGFVESGKYPRVYLTLNVPLSKPIDSTNILDQVIRYAKVTVSDGSNTEILTSRWDDSHFPPYVYTATSLKGVEGRSYTLKVEYGGFTMNSSTSLPQSPEIVSIQSEMVDFTDTLRLLSVTLNIAEGSKTAYRIFTRKSSDSRYIETPFVYNNTLNDTGLKTYKILPSPTKTDASYAQGKYFVVGEKVDVKVCAIDSVSNDFFKELTLFNNTAENILLNEVKPLKSNISSPGFGIWYGVGVKTLRYVVN